MDATTQNRKRIYALVVQEVDSNILVRIDSAPHTPVGLEELQKRAGRIYGASIRTEYEQAGGI